jgi:predicted enzyme related to lactoylglutathione lyase
MDPVVHFEMPYDDAARAIAFYRAAFGWELQQLGEDMGHYILATTARADAKPGGAAGAIDGGLFPRKPDWPGQHPSVVIAVQDIAAGMQRVRAAGGEVFGEPMEIPGIGRYVAFQDPEGNRLSMLQPVPRG